METSKRTIGDVELTIHSTRTVIIGAGVAGLNAAEHLHEQGHDDVVVVTSQIGGASSDPASAKSAYYRMGMSWETPDSPMAMAKALSDGGMTHGDVAYVEAVNSIPAFLRLASRGIPFPRDEFGTYTGAGEQGRLATAGARTSVLIADRSLERVRANRTPILNRHTAIALLVAGEGDGRNVVGVLAVDLRKASKPAEALVVFNCRNVILATGGPAALFEHTVHSISSASSLGLGLKSGAAAANLTETRFGLAFAKSRKPLSGDLQRVIPTYFSIGKGGRDTKMFLADYFHATKQIASAIFLKGDGWPFSAGRLQGLGPSILDVAVYNEIAARRRVFVTFTQNVKAEGMGQFNISQLDPAARQFLEENGATQFSPFDRLRHLDRTLIDTMLDEKIDLREPQEITLCAEDTFGGLAVDLWWETTIPHLFAVGDVACTHGDPPEGAELNAGQVGGLRAAERVVRHYDGPPMPVDDFMAATSHQVQNEITNLQRYVYGPLEVPSVRNIQKEVRQRMSLSGGMIRGVTGLTEAANGTRQLYQSIRTDGQRLSRQSECAAAVENELLCLTQIAFLEAMRAYIENGGGSRGAYLILDEHGDATVLTKRGAELRHRNENMGMRSRVLQTVLREGTTFETVSVPTRPIPGVSE